LFWAKTVRVVMLAAGGDEALVVAMVVSFLGVEGLGVAFFTLASGFTGFATAPEGYGCPAAVIAGYGVDCTKSMVFFSS